MSHNDSTPKDAKQNKQSSYPPIYHEGMNCWLVTQHADAREILKHTDTFSSESVYGDKLGPLDIPEAVKNRLNLNLPLDTAQLVSSDNPRHSQIKQITAKLFSNEQLKLYEPIIQEVIKNLINPLVSPPAIDLYSQFIAPFANYTVLAVIGFKIDDLPNLAQQISNAARMYFMILEEADLLSSVEALEDLQSRLRTLVQKRRESPKDDLVSKLITLNEVSKHKLSDDEILQFLLDLIFAGSDPVIAGLSSLFLQLLTHPEQLEESILNVNSIDAKIEEAIRVSAGLRGLARRTVKETTLGGQLLETGSTVLILPSFANRDKTVFENPTKFCPERENLSQHLGFGYGPHFCVGAALARLELKLATQSLLLRFPKIKLIGKNPLDIRKGPFISQIIKFIVINE